MSESAVKSALKETLTGLAEDGGDLGDMRQMAVDLAELIRPYAAPGFECLMAPLPPTPPTAHQGVDGIIKAWDDFGGTFQSVRAELERIEESDRALVLFVRQFAVTGHGGVELSQPGALVITLDGEQIANVQFHLDPEAARKAGGL